MNLRAILPFARHVAGKSIRRAASLARLLQSENKRIIFVFGGRTHHWPGMGRTLYENEPVFRESVQETSRLIYEISGFDIQPNFVGPVDPKLFASGNGVMFTIMALQIALTDLWRANGVVPDATMGVSLGEMTAAYAAGGLSRIDVVRISTAWFMASLDEDKDFLSIYIKASMAEAQALCRRCPVMLVTVYETGSNSVLVFCRLADKATVAVFLNENGVAWEQPYAETTKPFHTPQFNTYRQLMWDYLKQVRPQPLQLDFYSATLGRSLSKHSLIPTALWHELICSPVLLYTTLQQALADQYGTMVHIGPHPFLTGSTQKKAFDVTKVFLLLDSMRYQTSELDVFRQTHRKLRLLNWRKQLLSQRVRHVDSDDVTAFVQNLNLATPASVNSAAEIGAYLRSKSRICYLPVHQAWLTCSYEEVNYVLQHPELFSSNVYQNFDSFLLGVDPPDHTLVRTLLQSLFTPRAITDQSDYFQRELETCLPVLVGREQFDVVEELTIPLVKTAIAFFMGLSPTEDNALQASLNGHLYSMSYLNDLESFFQSHLERSPTSRVGQALLEHVQAGRLPFAGAVSLMKLVWVAGTATTSALLSNAFNTLLRQPHLTQQLQNDNALIPKFVEECLRLEPSESTLWRMTTQPTLLAGQELPSGSIVILSLLAANRDPQVFDHPDDWKLDRPARRSVTFGGGAHHCIGAAIARLQAQLFVRTIIDWMPGLQLAVPGPAVYYTPTSIRGLAELQASTVQKSH